MPYFRDRVQVFTKEGYVLLDTSVEGWKLLGISPTPYKRVRHHRPTGGAIIDELEVAGVASKREMNNLAKELGLDGRNTK